MYPQSAIKFSDNNKGKLFNEIRKCFGTIGSYAHGTNLNSSTFRAMDKRDTGSSGGGAVAGLVATAINQLGSSSLKQNWLLAYDFETFAKSATESGINVADRALPVSLELKRVALKNIGGFAGAVTGAVRADGTTANDASQTIRYDCFAMCDCIIYIDLMGKITTRI